MTLSKGLLMLRSLMVSVVVVLAGCGGAVVGNGQMASDTRTVALFTEAEVASDITLTIKQGELSGVELSGESNVLPLVLVTVVNNRLDIRLKPMTTVLKISEIKATVTVPRLEHIKASGSVDVIAFGLHSDGPVTIDAAGSSSVKLEGASGSAINLTVAGSSTVTLNGLTQGPVNADVQGSSDLTIDNLRAATSEVTAGGSSTASLSGAVTTTTLLAQGASDIDASRLSSQVAELTAQGSSDVLAKVTDEVRGSATGSSSITISGSPASREVRSEGDSTVKYE